MRLFYQYLRGILGQASILTLAFLIHFIGRHLFKLDMLPAPDQALLLGLVAVMGTLLYVTALGGSRWDLYRLGYQPILFLLLLMVGTLLSWFLGHRIAAVIVVIAVIAYNLNFLESDNLWDYLIDPFITIYAFIWAVKSGLYAMGKAETHVLSFLWESLTAH